jgi:Fe-S-cluster containining protein
MIHCKDCKSDCCKYIAVEIDEPETPEEFDEIRWFVAHENVRVYKDSDEDWLVEFVTPCKMLDEHNNCKIYGKRPKICDEHGMDECVQNGEGDVELILFETVEQVEEYMKKKFPGLKLPLHG